MPWPAIDPGKLRHLLIFYLAQPTSPASYDAGGPVTAPTEILRAYGSSDPATASDVIKGGQTVSEAFIPLVVRYDSRIQQNMTVLNTTTNSTYVVRGIINHEDRNVLLTLQCVAIGANQ